MFKLLTVSEWRSRWICHHVTSIRVCHLLNVSDTYYMAMRKPTCSEEKVLLRPKHHQLIGLQWLALYINQSCKKCTNKSMNNLRGSLVSHLFHIIIVFSFKMPKCCWFKCVTGVRFWNHHEHCIGKYYWAHCARTRCNGSTWDLRQEHVWGERGLVQCL